MKIAILKNDKSYFPEAPAYKKYFERNKNQVDIGEEKDLSDNYDFTFYFRGGLEAFFKKMDTRFGLEIHEFQSLSLPPFSRTKNKVKRFGNRRPAGRIFLNNVVESEFSFQDQVPSLLRDMGADSGFFDVRLIDNFKDFDLVYSGNLGFRAGFSDLIIALTSLGFRILLIGEPCPTLYKKFKFVKSLVFTGRVDRSELPLLYSRARYGLNYVPDVYPYNIQTSTKVIEYCAAGLPVISNKYNWITKFEAERNGKFLWLENIKKLSDCDKFVSKAPDVSDLEWSCLLDKVNLLGFLSSLLKSS